MSFVFLHTVTGAACQPKSLAIAPTKVITLVRRYAAHEHICEHRHRTSGISSKQRLSDTRTAMDSVDGHPAGFISSVDSNHVAGGFCIHELRRTSVAGDAQRLTAGTGSDHANQWLPAP